MNTEEYSKRSPENFRTRRKLVAGLAGLITGGTAFSAVAQFSFSFGGGDDNKRNVLDLTNLFDAGKSLFDGFTMGEEDEIELGEKMFPRLIDREGGAYANRKAQRGLQLFAEPLWKTSERDALKWDVVLINNNTVNAWALPGGKIAVYKGLLRYVSSEEELAAVLAHEMGHVELSHGLSQMKTRGFAKGLSEVAQATILKQDNKSFVNNLVLDQLEDRMLNLMTSGYSREREDEADRHILKVFSKVGYDPAKAPDFFKTLLQIIPPDAEETTSLFSTHPGTKERIERIQEAASEMPRPDRAVDANGYKTVKRYFPSRKRYRRTL